MKKYVIMTILGFTGGVSGALVINKIQNRGTQTEKILVSNDQGFPIRTTSFTEKMSPAEMDIDFVTASEASTPSVVYIKTISESRASNSWFDWYFGGGPSDVISSGSGVIFSNDGYIVTNNHVIANSKDIEVIYKKVPYKATVTGRDPSSDLAVLKIEGENFPAIKLGNSRDMKVGEWVLAVGNPFNLNSTVTAGIVSAKGRNLNIVQNNFPIESFIQTDAAINPGNSGGALVNLHGELIGINTAILSRTGSYAGYGFAVPIDIVSKIVNDLIKYGKVQKAFTGADINDLDYETGQRIHASDLSGVVVTSVHEAGPADKGGLVTGDIILKVDGRVVDSKANFDEEISYRSPGDKITLQVKRGEKLTDVVLLLTNEEGLTGIVARTTVPSETLGADFENLSKVEKDLYNIDAGVKVTNIRGGTMRRMGLEDGFIIISVNGKKITTPEEAIASLEGLKGRITLEGINKNGGRGFYSFIW